MNKLMKGIGAFILACIAFAILILTPISFMLGWHPSVSGLLCVGASCELLFFTIWLYLYEEDSE